MTNNLISTKDAAVILDVSARTVVRWIHDGRLPGAVKVNPRAFAIPKESVVKLAKARMPELPPEPDAAHGTF
jgi:excisionase family DNA binding protein